MPQAIWHGVVLAESENTEMVEGNHYFPLDSLNEAHFRPSSKQTVCSWKGIASYYDVVVDGQVNAAAAWTYRDPKPAAANIKDHVAFWGGVEVNS